VHLRWTYLTNYEPMGCYKSRRPSCTSPSWMNRCTRSAMWLK